MQILKSFKEKMRIFPAQEKSDKDKLREFLLEKNVWIDKQMKQREDRPNQRYLEGMKTVCCQVINFLGKDK